jgi:dihydroxyacetone kinase-like protein
MKKILNAPGSVVDEMLQGMTLCHPDIVVRLEGHSVLLRKKKKEGKVALVSGGGSGHEPSHGGYVGQGMLDAAVSGEVFTSPTPDPILAAVKAVQTDAGVLLVVKNYSGDVMNFEMAAEMAEAEGIKTAMVVVNDDVAVENSTYTTGRRGIAGTVFVHKIAGALAEQGASLEEVKAVAEKTIARVRSKGVALTPCTVPAVGKPGFSIGESEMELGLGIHGEPGVRRVPIMSAGEIASELLGSIIEDLCIEEGEEAALLVNGLGGTPLMELYVLAGNALEICAAKKLRIQKVYTGNFMTSIEMAGASLSLLRLDDDLKSLLAEPARTPAFIQ